MHAKVKGTKETVRGLGSESHNTGTGKQGGQFHLAVIIGLYSVSTLLFSFLNEMD